MLANNVWIITIIGLALICSVFLYVVISSTKQKDYSEVQSNWYSARRVWFIVLLTVGVIVASFSLSPFPIMSQQDHQSTGKVVNVTGYQWYWEIDAKTYEVGETIEFHVTSADSNHGFAIYDKEKKLVTQTQAMPDYINKLTHTFSEPGTYQVLCLEYCGLAHHSMTADLEVLPAGESQHVTH